MCNVQLVIIFKGFPEKTGQNYLSGKGIPRGNVLMPFNSWLYRTSSDQVSRV